MAITNPSGTFDTNSAMNYLTGVDTQVSTKPISDVQVDLSKSIADVTNIGNTKVDLSGLDTIKTNLSPFIQDIQKAGSQQITKEGLDQISSLRNPNPYEDTMKQGVTQMADYSTGNSQVDRTLANRYLTKFDTSAAASNLSQAQKIAANPYLSSAGKQVAAAELQRMTGAARSDLVGQLAEKAQERAFTATEKLAQYSIDAARYTEDKFKTDVTVLSDQLTRNLNASIAAGSLAATEASNEISRWSTEVSARINDLDRATNAAIAAGQLTKDEAILQLNKATSLITTQQQNIQNGLSQATAIVDFSLRSETNDMAREELGLRKQELDLTKRKVEEEIIGTTTGRAASYIEKNLLNPDGSRREWQDVYDDPFVKTSVDAAYQAAVHDTTGTAIPPDEWVETFINSVHTPNEQSILEMRERYGYANMTPEDQTTFDQTIDYMKTLGDFGFIPKKNPDGTISLINTEGEAEITFDKDGNVISSEKQITPEDKLKELGVTDWSMARTSDGRTVYRDNSGKELFEVKSDGSIVDITSTTPNTTSSIVPKTPTGITQDIWDTFTSAPGSLSVTEGKAIQKAYTTDPTKFEGSYSNISDISSIGGFWLKKNEDGAAHFYDLKPEVYSWATEAMNNGTVVDINGILYKVSSVYQPTKEDTRYSRGDITFSSLDGTKTINSESFEGLGVK